MVIELPWGRCYLCNTFFYLECFSKCIKCFQNHFAIFFSLASMQRRHIFAYMPPIFPVCKKFPAMKVLFLISNMMVVQGIKCFFFMWHLKFATCCFLQRQPSHLGGEDMYPLPPSDLNCLMNDTDIKVLNALQVNMCDLNRLLIF